MSDITSFPSDGYDGIVIERMNALDEDDAAILVNQELGGRTIHKEVEQTTQQC